MNLRQPNANEATGTVNRSRDVVPMSGICTRCMDGCKGSARSGSHRSGAGRSCIPARSVRSPQVLTRITRSITRTSTFRGTQWELKGLPEGTEIGPDTAVFSTVNTETEYGWSKKVKMRLPIFTGALGSTDIARINWEHFAIGAAISGITCVCGENVCGVDPQLERDNKGKVKKSPEMDRRIEVFKKFQDGYGEILVQMNVEDTRLGTAEYVASKHNLDTIELKWGQGAKCIGGEIKVKSLERAIELKKRGYIVLPDPTVKENQAAFKAGAIKEFERHSRLGFVTKEGFHEEIDRLRDIGFKRITLKTGAYSMVELAMAMRYCSDAKIDLLTIDGAPGGTGMSPWPMMNEWGIPSFYIHSLAYEFAEKLSKKGMRVPDLAFAGGFSDEPGVFKALAMGSPYVKAVCMGTGTHDPRHGGQEHREMDQGWRPAQDRLQVRQQHRGDLCMLRGAQGEIRLAHEGDPDGCSWYLHLCLEIPDRAPADHGGQQELPALDDVT